VSDELLTYVIIGAVIIGVLVTVIRLVLLGLGVSALRELLKRRRR
jgi:hypothetical protein